MVQAEQCFQKMNVSVKRGPLAAHYYLSIALLVFARSFVRLGEVSHENSVIRGDGAGWQ